MAQKTALGTLGVTIAAYAGQFVAELTKTEGFTNSFQKKISSTITKAGLDIVGLGNAAKAIKNEFLYVWQNMDKIKGISPEAVASVNELKTTVEELRNTVHVVIGESLGLFAQFGKSLGLSIGALFGAIKNMSWKDILTGNITSFLAEFTKELENVDEALKSEFYFAAKAAQAQQKLARDTAAATEAAKKQKAQMDEVNTALNAFFDDLDAQSKSMKDSFLNELKGGKIELDVKTDKSSPRYTPEPTHTDVADSLARLGLITSERGAQRAIEKQTGILEASQKFLATIARNTGVTPAATFAT